MVAIAFALAIALAIYAFGNTSGAHLNPAVTVSLAAVRRFPWSDVPSYVGAQLIGALGGAALIPAIFGSDAIDLGSGQTSIADGTTYLQAIVAEAIGTFLLVTAIMALAVDRRAPGGWAGLMIGLAVAAAILLIGPLTGGSLNPARTFGPLVVSAVGGGDAFWRDLPAYVIGPFLGGNAGRGRLRRSRAAARVRRVRAGAGNAGRHRGPRGIGFDKRNRNGGDEQPWLRTEASHTWARARSRCRTSTFRPSS